MTNEELAKLVNNAQQTIATAPQPTPGPEAVPQSMPQAMPTARGATPQPAEAAPAPAVAETATAPVSEAPVAPAAPDDPFADLTDPYATETTDTVVSPDQTTQTGQPENPFSDLTDPYADAPATGTVNKDLSKKDKLTADDIENLSFEDILKLADVNSPLKFSTKAQLADAIRGATTTGGISELLVGTPFSSDEVEESLEAKYQDFVSRNPEKAKGLLSQIGSSLLRGAPVDTEDSTIFNSPVRSFTDDVASGMSANYLDELTGIVSPDTATSIRASRQRLRDNDVVADDFIAQTLGALAPGAAIGKGVAALSGARAIPLLSRATTGGVAARAAAAAGIEEGLSASGETDSGDLGDRIGAGSAGAVIGAGFGAILGGIANKVMSGRKLSSKEKALSDALETTVETVNKSLHKGQPKASMQEIADAVASGKPLTDYLLTKGLNDNEASSVINRLSSGSNNLMDIMRREAIREQTRIENVLADERYVAGQNVDTARNALTPDDTADILRPLTSSNQRKTVNEELVIPAIRDRLKNTDVLKSLGYDPDTISVKSIPIFVDQSTGRVTIVRAGENGKPAPKVDKKYKPEDLQGYDVSGNEIGSIRANLRKIITGDSGVGPTKDRTLIDDVYRPIETQLSEGMGQFPELAKANDVFQKVIDKQKAFAAGKKGDKGVISFNESLKQLQDSGEISKDADVDSLKFLANQVATLAEVGKKANPGSIESTIANLISDFRIGGIFAGSLSSMARISMVNSLARMFKGKTILGKLSGQERRMEPVIRYLIGAPDSEMDAIAANMMKKKIQSQKDIDDFVLKFLIPLANGAGTGSANFQSFEEFGVPDEK